MSYTKLIYHIVFRTKDSEMTITEAYEKELYNYIWGYIRNKNGLLYRIGGIPDHLHILLSLPSDYSVSGFVRDLKTLTSKFLKDSPYFPDFTGWGESFAAFSYTQNDVPTIINYIVNQKEHHKTISFADEYRDFFLRNGGTIDEKYFLKD